MVTSFVHNTCSLAIYAIYWFSIIIIIIMQLNYSIKNCFIYIFINKKEKNAIGNIYETWTFRYFKFIVRGKYSFVI